MPTEWEVGEELGEELARRKWTWKLRWCRHGGVEEEEEEERKQEEENNSDKI